MMPVFGVGPTEAADLETCWPTQVQSLLLQAGLSRGEERSQALRRLEDCARVGTLPPSSERLLPLVYSTARESAADWPSLLKVAEPAYLRSWQQGEAMARCSARVLAVLHQASIPSLILKGPTLARSYGDPALRPASDLDVLVPGDQFADGHAALVEAGWREPDVAPEDSALLHARGLVRDGMQVDLHRHALEEFVGTRHDLALWAAAVPFPVMEQTSLSLGPCDRLLHVCTHGLRWNPEPPIHWIADAVMLLRDEEKAFDWDLFLRRAMAFDLALPATEGLAYIEGAFSVGIPEQVLRALSAAPSSWPRRLAYLARQRAPHRRRIMERAALRWEMLRRRRTAARQLRP